MTNAPDNPTEESLIEFPCEFPIKAVGKQSADVETIFTTIVSNEITAERILNTTRRMSGGGKYLAVTITVHAKSRVELDNIYQALTDHPDIVMAL